VSLRRPNPKSAVLMLLVSAGIVLGVVMIFRGAGSPVEPARLMAPTSNPVEFPEAGHYVILAEQVIAPRPTSADQLAVPALKLRLTRQPTAPKSPEEVVPIEPSDRLDWLYKILSRAHGRTLGHVVIDTPGTCLLDCYYAQPAPEGGRQSAVVLAFVRPASPGRLLWLLLGFGGQIVFSMRFLIQWMASERAGRSVVPRAFWYLSLAGGLMILAYAAYTRDPVFIAGYAPSSLIYLRNLVLLRRERAGETPATAGASRNEERP
jgi:lipid-A-disaccharide synthase-like uncharacterized protein